MLFKLSVNSGERCIFKVASGKALCDKGKHMPYDEKGEFYWEPMQDTTARIPNAPKKRTNLPLLRLRMNDEQRKGFTIALKYGARGTSVAVRAGKFSLGQAVVSACREIGTENTVRALEEAGNPEWSFCAIRYAPGITQSQRSSLAKTLTLRWFDQAQWVLENMPHVPDDEREVLKWLLGTR